MMMLVAHSSISSARPYVSAPCRPQVGAASSVNRAVRYGMKRKPPWSGVAGGGGVGGGGHRCIGMVVHCKVRKSAGKDSWRGCCGDDAGASAAIVQNGGTGATTGVQHAPRGLTFTHPSAPGSLESERLGHDCAGCRNGPPVAT